MFEWAWSHEVTIKGTSWPKELGRGLDFVHRCACARLGTGATAFFDNGFRQQTTGGYLMSVLGKIVSAIFGHGGAAPAPGPSTPAARAAPTASATPKASSAPAGASAAPVDVAATLTKLAASNKERLDWKKSIVDLMKLLKLDSSLAARKELADELHYTGDKKDSATMNVWLHKQVMLKLAENGGKVPDELRK
jgi:hypothetical protein